MRGCQLPVQSLRQAASKSQRSKQKTEKTTKIFAAKEQYVPLLREMKHPRHGYDYGPMIYECDLCE